MLREMSRIIGENPLLFLLEVIAFGAFLWVVIGGLSFAPILFPEMIP
jgi:hypothetical protein